MAQESSSYFEAAKAADAAEYEAVEALKAAMAARKAALFELALSFEREGDERLRRRTMAEMNFLRPDFAWRHVRRALDTGWMRRVLGI